MLELFIIGLLIVGGWGALKTSVKRLFKPIDRALNAADSAMEVVELQTKIWSDAKKRELNKQRSAD